MPVHCTAIGKVLLAYADPEAQQEILSSPLERRTPHTIVAPGLLERQLAAVLENGVAFEREESAAGLQCIAAPVLADGGDKALAAISVTGPVGRFRPEAHVTIVRAAAQGLSSLASRRRSLSS